MCGEGLYFICFCQSARQPIQYSLQNVVSISNQFILSSFRATKGRHHPAPVQDPCHLPAPQGQDTTQEDHPPASPVALPMLQCHPMAHPFHHEAQATLTMALQDPDPCTLQVIVSALMLAYNINFLPSD